MFYGSKEVKSKSQKQEYLPASIAGIPGIYPLEPEGRENVPPAGARTSIVRKEDREHSAGDADATAGAVAAPSLPGFVREEFL